MHVKEFYHFDLKDFTGYFEHERQVKYKLEDDPSCGITTGVYYYFVNLKFILMTRWAGEL